MKQILILLVGLFSIVVVAQPSDKDAIRTTLNNYIDGFYKGDASKLKTALKPRLYKFGYWKNKDTGEYEYYQHMTYDQAIDFVNKMKAEGRTRDETKIRKAEILDVGHHIASAKITAVWGVDYVLLSKENDQWMIEQVIWEGPYIEEVKPEPVVTTYYLIRHAEKRRSNPNDKNPELTNAGLKRAQKWSNTFKDIAFDAVYSTNYKRTLMTAQPTANAKNLEIQTYQPNNMDMDAFFKATKGKQVLVVGHSNTTPFMANALVGEMKYQNMDDTNNAGLYIVTITEDSKTSTLIQIN